MVIPTGDRTARLQAIRAYPYLASNFIDPLDPLHKAVEARAPLGEVIAERMKSSEVLRKTGDLNRTIATFAEIARVIRNLPADEQVKLIRFDADSIARAARFARPDQVPQETEGLFAFFKSAAICNTLLTQNHIPMT